MLMANAKHPYMSCDAIKHRFPFCVFEDNVLFSLSSLTNLNPLVHCRYVNSLLLVLYLGLILDKLASSICWHHVQQSNFWLCCSRLPGPSRVPAAGSSTKVQGASNLNRRSQSFNSIDKNKPPQYANGNDKGKHFKNLHISVHSHYKRKTACQFWKTELDSLLRDGLGVLYSSYDVI